MALSSVAKTKMDGKKCAFQRNGDTGIFVGCSMQKSLF